MVLTARTDKFTMDYCRFGSGPENFVIIPGISTRPVADIEPAVAAAYSAFTDRFTVYLFDRRNELPESYSIEEMAEDTVLVIKQLGLQKICLYGASLGGMISMVIAAEHPGLVDRLVIASATSRAAETDRTVIGKWLELARDGKGEELNADMIDTIYSKAFIDANRDAMDAAVLPLSREALDRFIIQLKPAIDFDFFDSLSEISCDTLIIASSGDRVFTDGPSRDIAGKLGCRLIMYGPEYGHAVYDEAPDCTAEILGFVSGKQSI